MSKIHSRPARDVMMKQRGNRQPEEIEDTSRMTRGSLKRQRQKGVSPTGRNALAAGGSKIKSGGGHGLQAGLERVARETMRTRPARDA